MSATDHPTTPGGARAPAPCPRCGAPVGPDQDWCLNCGAAVATEVAGPPAWRTPIAIVGGVLAVAAVALVLAFLELSGDAEQVARAPEPTPAATAAPGTTPAPTTTPDPAASVTPSPVPGATTTPDAGGGVTAPDADGATATPSPTTTPDGGTGGDGFDSWPSGRTAFTVILWSATSRSGAEAKAEEFQAAGQDVGILDSSDFSSLRSGYQVVFSGTYDDLDAAQSAAKSVQGTAPGAYAKQVKPK